MHIVAGRTPKISILLITYNHAKYIGQAIESILMQETEYDVEINVIEDCSTDGTQDVVMGYVELFPEIVKPYFNKKNIGFKVTQKNFYRGFKTLDGEYCAILEGDDYWSSKHKLQKQIAFLEANPDYVACAHNVIKFYEDGSKEPHRFLYWPGKPADHTVEDLILIRSYFHTTTLTYRNVFKGKPPEEFSNPWSCDIYNTIAHVQFGKLRYFDDDMSVYRAHAGGRFSGMETLKGWFFNIGGLRRYNAWMGYRYIRAFSQSIIQYCNVVLQDKGKEARLLVFHERMKYIGIRSVYQIILSIVSTPDRVPHKPRTFDASGLKGMRHITARLWHSLYLVRYSIYFCLFLVFLLLAGFLHSIYTIISEMLPESAKDRIRRFEMAHRSAFYMRYLLRKSQLFKRRGFGYMKNSALASGRNFLAAFNMASARLRPALKTPPRGHRRLKEQAQTRLKR